MSALQRTSILCRFPLEILENIALEVIFVDPHGRPLDLLALLCTCKQLYERLSYETNAALCARVFKRMFDVNAARRRLGHAAVRSSNLAAQLKLQCDTLRHIRRCDICSPSLLDDFWVAFTMMSENDGRNKIQLEKAGLPELLERWVRQKVWDRDQRPNDWPANDTVKSLGLWLTWFMTDEGQFSKLDPSAMLNMASTDKVSSESLSRRQEIMDVVRPYVLLPCRVSVTLDSSIGKVPLTRVPVSALPRPLQSFSSTLGWHHEFTQSTNFGSIGSRPLAYIPRPRCHQ
jgi:hypothetical protein